MITFPRPIPHSIFARKTVHERHSTQQNQRLSALLTSLWGNRVIAGREPDASGRSDDSGESDITLLRGAEMSAQLSSALERRRQAGLDASTLSWAVGRAAGSRSSRQSVPMNPCI